MAKTISIGNQGFDDIREKKSFYIDKTQFIREWWESEDVISLITRPRRFGKTLNMSMLECFFSNRYAQRGDLFSELSIWNDEKYRKLQGTYPVIFVSFAAVKADNFFDARNQIIDAINEAYTAQQGILESNVLTDGERMVFSQLDLYTKDASVEKTISNDIVCGALRTLCTCLMKVYGKKAIVLLDEYDTPMQEAYVNGYWDEFTAFIRSLFNAAFKTNQYLERAVMTGITRVSKQSIFSDLNNLTVITTSSDRYADCFGFTEKEVFAALDEFGMGDKKAQVKEWYDGFVFGGQRDIYNPWSITNFLKEKKFKPYWASTSSNALVNKLIQTGSAKIKTYMEELISGKNIVVNFDEQIVFEQLETDENAIWSLLLASGYLKAEEVDYRGRLLEPWYHLSITNLETYGMFDGMFRGWFNNVSSDYNAFVKALLSDNVEEMNLYMNDVALATFSNFDTGKQPSQKTQPERFYHGFVLGLLVELRDTYEVLSNHESGYGRYDIMLVPRDSSEHAIIIEFKVKDFQKEQKLSDTVRAALSQIEEKRYDSQLIEKGFDAANIRHYGFAFEGKHVLIGK
ncbi:AAA family ATPase [Agathobacter sp.]